MKPLTATLRLQFHSDFTLDHAVPLVPYFAQLGISHLYASPILKARAGSRHGYDVVDPTCVNPELGGEAALERLVAALRQHGMGLILDTVSNHMAVGGADNPWWQSLLAWGRRSPYAEFFDIQWHSPDPLMEGQLLLPFLAGHLARPWLGAWIGRQKRLTTTVDRGAILLVVYASFSAAVVEGLWSRVSWVDLAVLVALSSALLAAVLWLTWMLGRWLGFSREDAIVLQFCGSKKSLATGVPMAGVLFPASQLGAILLPVMIFHQIQLMVCAVLARRYGAAQD